MRTPTLLLAVATLASACAPQPIPYAPRLFNSQPVALIAAEPTAPLLGAILLDGTRSYDPDGDAIAFSWRVHDAPDDSALPPNPFDRNDDRNASVTSVIPDVLGRYTFALAVDDGQELSASAHVVVDVVLGGTPPLADAGVDGAGLEGATVCVDGADSFDPLGAPLTWAWSIAARPPGSTLSTTDLTADGAAACFAPDAPGLYTLGLVVDADGRSSAPDYVDVSIASTNQPPLAAFEALDTSSCAYIALDGMASTDADGDALGYRWLLLLRPPGSLTPLGGVAFDDPEAVDPRFYADLEGEYVVQLTVFDGEDWSAPAILVIDATETVDNTPPVVEHQGDIYFGDAPSPCQASCPTKFTTLDASGSVDSDDDPVSVTWELVSGPGTLDGTDGLTVDLQLPGPPGSCSWGVTNATTTLIRVTATDCSGASDSSEVVVLYSCAMGL